MEIPPDLEDKLILQAIHFGLTAPLKQLAREKFGVLLRHNDEIVRVNVRLQQDQQTGRKHHYVATGRVEIRGPDLVASAAGPDAGGALEGLADKLDALLRDRQGRRKERRNHPRDIELNAALPKPDRLNS
ncbi:MAG TPA: HPF/RaiA family ribosome-associated protein [Lacunisphaera sp.]|jgi:putative sigma-54 modulation protein|nr:HPF/RaiA family ribosome-associated protein [Lacunisphaera sp.]